MFFSLLEVVLVLALQTRSRWAVALVPLAILRSINLRPPLVPLPAVRGLELPQQVCEFSNPIFYNHYA